MWDLNGQICHAVFTPYHSTWPHSTIRHVTDITEEDVDAFKERITSCGHYYFDQTLHWCYADDRNCPGIPQRCIEGNAVFKVLYYLADKDFMPVVAEGQVPSLNKLSYTLLHFRGSWNPPVDEMTTYFLENLDGVEITSQDGTVISRAYVLGIFSEVFGNYIVMDLPYYALAMGLVLFVIILYLRSIVLTLVILLSVMFTIAVGYFLYFVVFRFVFFPFMNLLAGLLLIAVGADDVFIIRDIWMKYSYDEEGNKVADIERIVSKTLNHGILSILVTSLTTAAALFANFVSSITVLKCFSVFCRDMHFGRLLFHGHRCSSSYGYYGKGRQVL